MRTTVKCTPKVGQTFGGAFYMAKKGQTFKKYSPEFKISVIMDMREHGMSYGETIRKYWSNLPVGAEHNHTSQLRLWERIYLTEGAEGFMKERRGRSSKSGRPKKTLDKSVENDLITENQRLRMELEYLKKLSALVLAEEQENGRKPK